MTEIMPVPRKSILLSYQQRALRVFLFGGAQSAVQTAAPAGGN